MSSPPAGTAAPTLPVRLGQGAVGGIVAGAGFIALNIWFADATGNAAVAPFTMISTILLGPPPDAGSVALGVAVHAVLSLLFGLVFALLTHPWGTETMAAIAGLLYGGGLYVVNFQLLSRVVDYWGAFIQGTNQPFELASHLVFGALLGVFFPAVSKASGRARTEQTTGTPPA